MYGGYGGSSPVHTVIAIIFRAASEVEIASVHRASRGAFPNYRSVLRIGYRL